MSVIKEAYEQGQLAAFEKFAAGMSAAGIRGAVPNVPFAGAAASNTVPSPRALLGKAAPPVNAAGVAPAAGGAAAPGLMQRAWGGLNRVAANPLGSMALGTGLMMGVGKMMEPSNTP